MNKATSIHFKNFTDEDYENVCTFLIQVSNMKENRINWNWARWEWMYYHPDFDSENKNQIGLWYDGEQVIAMTTYDYYAGESAFVIANGYENLEDEVIAYSCKTYQDDGGLGIAINDEDKSTRENLLRHGFKLHENTENVLTMDLVHNDLSYPLSSQYTVDHVKGMDDVYEYNKVLWYGMDHEGEIEENEDTINKYRKLLSAKHINYNYNVFVKDNDKWIAFCSCWYDPRTDYAYVEPVCTLPEYRGHGIGRAVVLECLKRCKEDGAKRAFVISENEFYYKLGFENHSHYSFYWYHQNQTKNE